MFIIKWQSSLVLVQEKRAIIDNLCPSVLQQHDCYNFLILKTESFTVLRRPAEEGFSVEIMPDQTF